MKKVTWYTGFALLAASVVTWVVVAPPWATADESLPGVGKEQSPIDIVTKEAVEADLPALDFGYETGVNLEVVNMGSPDEEATIRANVPEGAGILEIGGTNYNLLQFHWHTPSEHELNREGFPMEMHLVHQKVGADDQLVVAVWLEIADDPHEELDKIFSDPPEEEGKTKLVRGFDLTTLLTEDLGSFRYLGSLTTPPFTEGVQWVVLEETLEVSQGQVQAFLDLFLDGNAREVQPLNGRTVKFDDEDDNN
jgi:carbonic anhydrase